MQKKQFYAMQLKIYSILDFLPSIMDLFMLGYRFYPQKEVVLWRKGVSEKNSPQKGVFLWTKGVSDGNSPQKGVVLWRKSVSEGNYPQKRGILWTKSML